MASSSPQGRLGYFDWVLCKVPSCPYNTTGIKVSNWWLFLCLTYISCFLVGTVFAVAGFASMGIGMAAVGVGCMIVGASLAIAGDILRRFGCGWTKIVQESAYPRQIVRENSNVMLPIPFLPGYPGFYIAGEEIRSDNPPPYVISQEYGNPNDRVPGPIHSCTCMTSANVTESAQVTYPEGENPRGSHAVSSEASHDEVLSRTANSREVAIVLASPVNLEHGTLNPPPPPYDFEETDSEDSISWLYDIPPPYGNSV